MTFYLGYVHSWKMFVASTVKFMPHYSMGETSGSAVYKWNVTKAKNCVSITVAHVCMLKTLISKSKRILGFSTFQKFEVIYRIRE